MRKLSLLLTSLGIISGLTACNSGSSGTTQSQEPPLQTSTTHKYQIYVKGNGAESNNVTVQNIHLMPLTAEQESQAKQIALSNLATLSTTTVPTSYNLANGISGFPNNFYTNASVANLIPLNQLSFGTCVTFSEAAALSYLYSSYSSTTDISPLDILDAGYALYPNDMSSTGWDGLTDASTLLNRLPTIGYYENYTATNSEYVALSNDYESSGDSGDLTIAQLTSLPDFSSQLTAYNNLVNTNNGSYTYTFNNLSGNWSTLFSAPAANNSQLITNALDNGQVVLIDFNVYDANVASNSSDCQNGNIHTVGTIAYQYDSNSNVLNQISAAATSNNTWAYPTGCLAGGHQVWIIGYAKASDGSVIFIVRNSWGNSGDQGQYYMTDTYLNSAATYAAEVSAPAA